jgi:DNA polymerase III epsilon subunit-like protein
MTDLNQTVETINHLLEIEHIATIKSRADLEARKTRRKELGALLCEIETAHNQLIRQVRKLPALPGEEFMDWAEAVLSMPNLAIVVLDTTSLNENADIIRVHAIDGRGESLLDVVVQPKREKTPNTAYTGISQEELDRAPMLKEIWYHIHFTLRGRFFVSFNLDFIETRLDNNIKHYGLQRLPFIGDCLMYKSKSYFNVSYGGLKLPEACLRIGKQLPTNPPLAADRALGCLNLLLAMSQGVTSAPTVAPPITVDTDLGELLNVDDHPF